MSLKTPGKIDFRNGKLKWFVCYDRCPYCERKHKVLLDRSEYDYVRNQICKPVHYSPKETLKRVLIKAVDKL